MAGITACTKQPKEVIVPYVRQPEEFIPGVPLYYATAMQMGGVGTGLLATSYLGRPTKIEGNPDHPGSLGASDYFHQASILTMYDPDRAQAVTKKGLIDSWVAFQGDVASRREAALIEWRGPSHSDGNGDVADAHRGHQCGSERFARREMASI